MLQQFMNIENNIIYELLVGTASHKQGNSRITTQISIYSSIGNLCADTFCWFGRAFMDALMFDFYINFM